MNANEVYEDDENGNNNAGNVELICTNEMEVYKHLPVPSARRTNPLKWWNDNKARLPNLRQLAFKLLCIPATSAPSERLWSIAANIIVKKRACSEPSIVADLVMLKVNGDILKKHHGEDQQRIIPTVYDEEEGNLDEVEILAIIQTLDNEQQDEDKN